MLQYTLLVKITYVALEPLSVYFLIYQFNLSIRCSLLLEYRQFNSKKLFQLIYS